MVSEEGATIQYQYMRNMTSRRDIDAIPGLRDDPFLLGMLEQTPYTVPMPTIPQVNMVWTPISEMFNFTWSGELTIEEAQERAMDTYRLLLTVAGHDTDF
jgi:arabinogalactan oligomer/maltooligosaccharide transport system substrate-binding protein